MSSPRRKDELKAARESEARERELARVRRPDEDMSYPGAGITVIRLIVVASFEHTVCWEIRELSGELLLFRCRSPEPDQYGLMGETKLAASGEDLQAIVDGFRQFSLPIFPMMARSAVADGGRNEVILRAGWDTEWRVSWSDGYHPPEWEQLVNHVAALLVQLKTIYPE